MSVSYDLRGMTIPELCRLWWRRCGTHDRAVDNEPMNSPTIEAARGDMDRIEAEFKRRGTNFNHYDDDGNLEDYWLQRGP